MNYNIAVIPGDGIGPEIIREARKVLDQVGRSTAIPFIIQRSSWAAVPIDAYGVPLTRRRSRQQKKATPCCWEQ